MLLNIDQLFSFYIIYLPYLMLKKSLELGLKIFLIGIVLLILFEFKWLVQENLFDSELTYNGTFVEKFVHVGKSVIKQGTQNGAELVKNVVASEVVKGIFE